MLAKNREKSVGKGVDERESGGGNPLCGCTFQLGLLDEA